MGPMQALEGDEDITGAGHVMETARRLVKDMEGHLLLSSEW